MSSTLSGLELSRAFYEETVRGILERQFPDLVHSAALIGTGSEVLGYDDERSRDHHWGPRVMLFAAEDDVARYGDDVSATLAQLLPPTFMGISTNFGPADRGGIRLLRPVDGPPIGHRVELFALSSYLHGALGFDPRDGITAEDWLCTPSQRLLEMTAGAVFHDGLAALGAVRAALAWYPRDVWLYLLACQWRRISDEEAFAGRCDEAGDDVGSRLVAARLVRELMRLCFLLERRYSPYAKWLGTAFSLLSCGPPLLPMMRAALTAVTYAERERALGAAYEAVAALHNSLRLTDVVDPALRPYYSRPYLVLGADRFQRATLSAIDGEALASLRRATGSIDQVVDDTKVLSTPKRWRMFGALTSDV